MEYKGLQYKTYPEYSAISFEPRRNWEEQGVKAIIDATTFSELLGHLRPENVIIDERKSQRPPASFIDFLQKRLFKDSIDYGVRRIFYILREEEYQYAVQTFSNRPSFVHLCTTLEEVTKMIENSRNVRN